MTELDRRVATLAALFAPERAGAMLARLGTPGTGHAAAAHAAGLAGCSGRERLQALSKVLASDFATVHASAAALASAERPRVAALVRGLAAGAADRRPASPALIRLCRERIAG